MSVVMHSHQTIPHLKDDSGLVVCQTSSACVFAHCKFVSQQRVSRYKTDARRDTFHTRRRRSVSLFLFFFIGTTCQHCKDVVMIMDVQEVITSG